MSDTQRHYATRLYTAEAIRTRAVSPTVLTEAMLERIERLEPDLRAYVTVTAELARVQAKAADAEIAAGHYRGPLPPTDGPTAAQPVAPGLLVGRIVERRGCGAGRAGRGAA